MTTFIFKKDGEDNAKIINAILEFIKKDHRNLLLTASGGEKNYPCFNMLDKES